MAANHVSNQRQRQGGRKGQGGKQATSGNSSGSGKTLEGARDEVASYFSRGASQVRDLTRDHEGTVVLVALVAGFGAGLLIGGVLASSQQRPKTWRDRIAAEGIGRQLLERVESLIPETISQRLGG